MTTSELQQAMRLHERAKELETALKAAKSSTELRLRAPADGPLGSDIQTCLSLRMGELQGRIERAISDELSYVRKGLAKLGVSDD